MLIEDLIQHIENWAPPGVAWEKDNVGLQVGNTKRKVKNIFLALELTEKSLSQAIDKNCNFIFTHHPFIFSPLKKIDTTSNSKSKIIETLLAKKITLYSAHTNLDFTKDGVSFELAKILKLNDIQFLENSDTLQYKLTVFVPERNLQTVSKAIFEAGGGKIGEYESCSFNSSGKGTFKGSINSNPVIGKKLNFETVNENRLEVLVLGWNLNKVLSAMIKAHPYEEPAYDVYPLKNRNVNYGYGAIGELKSAMAEKEFLTHVCSTLRIDDLRFCKGKSNKIKRVAVCGGSGSDLINSALTKGADALVTADVKYHPFQDAEKNILLIDAGHYETEIPSLNEVKRKIEKQINAAKAKIKVYKYTGSTNPVKFYNNSRSK